MAEKSHQRGNMVENRNKNYDDFPLCYRLVLVHMHAAQIHMVYEMHKVIKQYHFNFNKELQYLYIEIQAAYRGTSKQINSFQSRQARNKDPG